MGESDRREYVHAEWGGEVGRCTWLSESGYQDWRAKGRLTYGNRVQFVEWVNSLGCSLHAELADGGRVFVNGDGPGFYLAPDDTLEVSRITQWKELP